MCLDCFSLVYCSYKRKIELLDVLEGESTRAIRPTKSVQSVHRKWSCLKALRLLTPHLYCSCFNLGGVKNNSSAERRLQLELKRKNSQSGQGALKLGGRGEVPMALMRTIYEYLCHMAKQL